MKTALLIFSLSLLFTSCGDDDPVPQASGKSGNGGGGSENSAEIKAREFGAHILSNKIVVTVDQAEKLLNNLKAMDAEQNLKVGMGTVDIVKEISEVEVNKTKFFCVVGRVNKSVILKKNQKKNDPKKEIEMTIYTERSAKSLSTNIECTKNFFDNSDEVLRVGTIKEGTKLGYSQGWQYLPAEQLSGLVSHKDISNLKIRMGDYKKTNYLSIVGHYERENKGGRVGPNDKSNFAYQVNLTTGHYSGFHLSTIDSNHYRHTEHLRVKKIDTTKKDYSKLPTENFK